MKTTFYGHQGYTFHVIEPAYKDHLCIRTIFCLFLTVVCICKFHYRLYTVLQSIYISVYTGVIRAAEKTVSLQTIVISYIYIISGTSTTQQSMDTTITTVMATTITLETTETNPSPRTTAMMPTATRSNGNIMQGIIFRFGVYIPRQIQVVKCIVPHVSISTKAISYSHVAICTCI